jgi:hypothetical protein
MATKIIEIKKGGGAVTLRISIAGMVGWVYKYAFKGGEFADASTGDGGEHVHPLGTPATLHLKNHAWRIVVGRLSDKEEKVSATLVWEQKVGGEVKELHRSESSATLKDGNEVELFKGSVAFKQVEEL